MKNLMAMLLVLAPSFGYAEIHASIIQNSPQVMPDSAYVFLNHSTAQWDSKESSRPGVNDLLSFAKANSIKSIATIHGEAFINEFGEEAEYFTNNANTDILMHSDGGAHRLKFPNAKAIIVGGGNLSVCLCESLRDVVTGVMSTTEDKEIFLADEAVYDTDHMGKPTNAKEMLAFVSNYVFPNFPCPVQQSTGFGPIDLSKVNLHFFYFGELIKKSNATDNSLPTISIRFEKLQTIKNALKGA